ncbi:MAG: hypothetical protein ACE5E6_11325 [Phycisphaerae bacterium]
MRYGRMLRRAALLAGGALVFQAAGCDTTGLAGFNELLQTVFLAITAAGSVAILQNI